MAASRYVAIEGPIGVGKTSQARRLADALNGELILEEAESNPFLDRFYQDPRGAALPAQLFFLFQRARQMEQLAQADMFSDVRVADFLMAKDQVTFSAGFTLRRGVILGSHRTSRRSQGLRQHPYPQRHRHRDRRR